eukprot:1136348-Pelagomonas_calceolata.AAC.1
MFKAGALPRRRAAAGAYAAGTEQGNAAAATSLVEPAPAVLALAACSRKHAVAHPTCARQWRIRHAHGELPFVRPQAHVVLVLLLSGAAGAGVLPCVPPQEHVVLSLAHSAVGYAEEEQAAARLDLAVCRAHEGVTLQLGEEQPTLLVCFDSGGAQQMTKPQRGNAKLDRSNRPYLFILILEVLGHGLRTML